MSAEILQFPEYIPEPLPRVDELIAASPELWERLVGSKMGSKALEGNIVLSEN